VEYDAPYLARYFREVWVECIKKVLFTI
jgi:hypothetical protein